MDACLEAGILFVKDEYGFWHLNSNSGNKEKAFIVLKEVVELLGYRSIDLYLQASENKETIKKRLRQALQKALQQGIK